MPWASWPPQSSDAPFDLEELTVGELSGPERFATRCPRSKPRIAPQDLSHGQPSTIDHKAVKTLESALGDASISVRLQATLALSRIGPVAAITVPSLIACLKDADETVRCQAAEALGHHRNAIATAALRGALENRDGFHSPETRASAVRAIGSLLPESEAGVLASAVADVDATVSLSAIAALADRDERTSAQALIGVLENRAGFYLPLTRQAAARALFRLRHCDTARVRGILEGEMDQTVREELQLIASR